MKASFDKTYNKYKDLDFADAKPVSETPHLVKLQAEAGGKSIGHEDVAPFRNW